MAHQKPGRPPISLTNTRIEMLELNARILAGEAPVDLHFLSIACLLPSSHLLFQMDLIANTWLQGMSSQYRQFNLGHIQPAAMRGRVVNFQFLAEPFFLLWRKDLVERGGRMRIQII